MRNLWLDNVVPHRSTEVAPCKLAPNSNKAVGHQNPIRVYCVFLKSQTQCFLYYNWRYGRELTVLTISQKPDFSILVNAQTVALFYTGLGLLCEGIPINESVFQVP